MEGVVTAYSGGSLVATMDLNSGTGTHSDWNINLAGQRGQAGATGAAGADGITTAVDFLAGYGVPDDADGNDLDFYWDYSTGSLYRKGSGAWGAPVANYRGNDGAAGLNGATWTATSSVPTGGNDGDLHLRTTTGDVYKNTSGSWAIVANIKGPTGSTGPGYAATSATSLTTAGSGSKTFTTQAGLAYSVGARIRATSAGSGDWMEGVVTSYSSTTLIVTMDLNSGTGTRSDWNINLAGQRGATGAAGPSNITTSTATDISGILKGNGATVTTAVANTDYQDVITVSSSGTSGAATLVGSTLNVPRYDSYAIPVSYLDTDGTLAANSDSKVATQKAVKTYADQLIAANDAMVFKGVVDCSANPNYPAADRGHTYKVSVAGKIGGASGTNVEAGDLLLCITDGTSAGNQATVGSAWSIAQTNIDGAVTGPASSTSGNFASYNGTGGKIIQDSGYAVASFGLIGSANTWTAQNTFAAGTITTSQPMTMTQTWNAGGVTFKGMVVNVTDTSSASASLLCDLQVSSSSKFSVKKDGTVTAVGGVVANSVQVATSGASATGSLFTYPNASYSGMLVIQSDTSHQVGIATNGGWPSLCVKGTQTVMAANSAAKSAATSSRVTIYSENASTIALALVMEASQTANAVNVTSNGGSAGDLASISKDGVIFTSASIELGHPSDTTLTRVSPGVAAIEGKTIAVLSSAQVFTKQQNFGAVALTSSSNHIAWNLDNAQSAQHTMTENTTLDNPTNIVDGGTYIIVVTQHASAAKTLAFGSAYKIPSGFVLTTTLSGMCVMTFVAKGSNLLMAYNQTY